MKAIALIPARLASTRLSEKLLIELEGKTVIQRTYEATKATGLFHEVIVVTDSDAIETIILNCGGRVLRSQAEYESGTDRIAAVAKDLDADVLLNVQGDEPFVQKKPLEQVLALFEGVSGAAVQVASIRKPITDPQLIHSPNVVKVVCDLHDNSLLFSRSPIPYIRDADVPHTYYQHIGVYAFRKEALMLFPTLAMTPLEKVEKIECLRFLENGIPLKMTTVAEMGIGIDVAEDIERAKAYLKRNS
ncbi:3-deoxy-manno-octulosonate cytidylyltransferase [Taibaiella sp. KBW10]|uniref:3-deoxy-manno-octulosonate cytidylyltransferase n=1 Tax=Taibaiella sp. KBW10 TaxID=2153357 RepID=UPI000F5ABB47|nr:3-deoxy-manno-octulosonate cytidylyltransferase [Taibaiella sp. KBW10]RQO32129.1 3-deoxy-manno-octulosonate cytidylyltransferase [Taibaiella sp. KBW10]